MAGAQSVWGLDLGRSALKAVKLRPGTDGNVELLAQDFVEHAKVLTAVLHRRDERRGERAHARSVVETEDILIPPGGSRGPRKRAENPSAAW